MRKVSLHIRTKDQEITVESIGPETWAWTVATPSFNDDGTFRDESKEFYLTDIETAASLALLIGSKHADYLNKMLYRIAAPMWDDKPLRFRPFPYMFKDIKV